MLPAPQRGEIVREIGDELRKAKQELGRMVTLEAGKIVAEGQGEVQEMIDIADFACGLSRQLYGLSMHSERPGHRMYEQWHPLGVVGVISAFNFPVAVWSWNALIAMVCGDTVVWKPSLKTPLCAVAVQEICDRVLERHGWKGVLNLVIGTDDVIGERLIQRPPRSAHQRDGFHPHGAACRAGGGRAAGPQPARTRRQQRRDRDGRCRSRPGGPRGAVRRGGHGRASAARRFEDCLCTKSIAAKITEKLIAAYKQIRIGDPLEPGDADGSADRRGRRGRDDARARRRSRSRAGKS